jgi:hypothetical protein
MDNEESFLSVLGQQNIESLLTPQEALKIRGKLWDLLAGRAESYTMGGSSSVRIETAQELLRSAGFVLRHALGEAEPSVIKDLLLNGAYDDLFRSGLNKLEACVAEGEALLQKALATATAVENAAYRGTLKELGVFFKRYHIHHFAHEIPCMLDYPLARPVDEALLGIDYIADYLRRLLLENDFLSRFDPQAVTLLLRSVTPDYKETLLNIYETVAANALAQTLLGGDVLSLDVTSRDRSRLLSLMGAWNDDIATIKLRAASSGLCAILNISDPAAADYLALTAEELYIRIRPVLPFRRLERVFPSLYREPEQKAPAITYIDGALMDDEKLRDLIDALTSCAEISEKLALAHRHTASLRDWAEILGICFWGEELRAVFDSFGHEELDLLNRFVREKRRKYPEWISETGWEDALTEYINTCS